MQDWYDIYKERMNKRYTEKVREKYRPFINKIVEGHAPQFVELGCGAGNITHAVRDSHRSIPRMYLVDNCPKMLGLALQNNPVGYCNFLCADITDRFIFCPQFDFNTVVHSHGVLEHFNDANILRIIRQADRIGGRQVHYVPEAKYEIPSRGDERLLSVDQWSTMMKTVKTELGRGFKFKVSTFNDGYDILIETDREFR